MGYDKNGKPTLIPASQVVVDSLSGKTLKESIDNKELGNNVKNTLSGGETNASPSVAVVKLELDKRPTSQQVNSELSRRPTTQQVNEALGQKADKTAVNNKQEKLVSGQNIKTVGGVSLLGRGNIPLPSGSGANIVQSVNPSDTTNAPSSKAVADYVAEHTEQGEGNESITIPTASTQYTSTIVGLQSDWAKDCDMNNVFGTQNLGSHCREGAWIAAQGQKTQTSIWNCAFGYHSMFQTYNGKYNVGLGNETLDNLTQGEYNTAIGTNALQMWGNSNKEATSNQSTAVGANSQRYTYNRRGNVSLGFESLSGKSNDNTITCCRDYNIAIGFKAGKYATSDLEVYIGSCTLSKPYVDNAEEKSCTLIYGKSDTNKNIENQFVKINGKFACNGVTPQAPLTANADATDLATALILLNQIKDALIKSGLMK